MYQIVKTLDFFNQVERKVEPVKVHERAEVLDLRDDVVVELQLG